MLDKAPQRPKILAVDDNETHLVFLQQVLGRVDAELFTVASGQDALTACAQHEFAVILLDIQMPGMDGFELAERLAQLPQAAETPLIFVTGTLADDFSRLRGYRAGAVDYLIKPVDATILQSKVRVFLDLQRQRLELRRALERQQQLATLALEAAGRDQVSDLANRPHFMDQLQRMTAGEGERRPGAVLLLEADGLQRVVGPKGYADGDRLLKHLGRRLGNSVRDNDSAARLDGTRFGVLLQAPLDGALALHLAQQIRRRLAEPFELAARGDSERLIFTLDVSLGAAVYPDDGADPAALLHAAEQALARAQAAGGNQCLRAGEAPAARPAGWRRALAWFFGSD